AGTLDRAGRSFAQRSVMRLLPGVDFTQRACDRQSQCSSMLSHLQARFAVAVEILLYPRLVSFETRQFFFVPFAFAEGNRPAVQDRIDRLIMEAVLAQHIGAGLGLAENAGICFRKHVAAIDRRLFLCGQSVSYAPKLFMFGKCCGIKVLNALLKSSVVF